MKKILQIIASILILSSTLNAFAEDVPAPDFKHTRHFEQFTIKDPYGTELSQEIVNNTQQFSPNVGGEVWYEFTIPPEVMDTLSEEEIDRAIYRSLIKYNTMEGIEYYSYRRKKYRLFLEQSYTVESKAGEKRIDDWKLADTEAIPSSKLYFVYQADTSFGDGIKEVHLSYSKDSHQFLFHILNATHIAYQGLITISDPYTSMLDLLITREGNTIKIYGVVATQAEIFKFLRERITYSVTYRTLSLVKWFESGVQREFASLTN